MNTSRGRKPQRQQAQPAFELAAKEGPASKLERRHQEAERMFRALRLDAQAGGDLYLERRIAALHQLIDEVHQIGKEAGLAEFVMAEPIVSEARFQEERARLNQRAARGRSDQA